jgi:hypothetical protein
MARGISLHVGVNKASDAFPNAPTLFGCEKDATAMYEIAVTRGFAKHALLVGPNATYNKVVTTIKNAAAELESGDIFFFTFAGHGTSEVDTDEDESDHSDETILLFDFLLFDDVLRKDLWPQFKPGVRIVMVSDSCHSGTVAFVPADTDFDLSPEPISSGFLSPEPISSGFLSPEPISSGFEPVSPLSSMVGAQIRKISRATGQEHIAEHRSFYEQVLLPLVPPNINASVLLLAACQDFEDARDGLEHGAFTQAMLNVLQSAAPPTNYTDLITDIGLRLGGLQTPAIVTFGQPNPIFLGEAPFTV